MSWSAAPGGDPIHYHSTGEAQTGASLTSVTSGSTRLQGFCVLNIPPVTFAKRGNLNFYTFCD